MGKIRLGQRAQALKQELREDFPLGRFIPSGLTLLGLCCGATAIRFAMLGNWHAAVAAVVLAAIFDLLDGRIARLFGVDSKFGAQLDSLADLVSFGIAPSVIVYTWTLYQAKGAGWAAVLVFCTCCAIRLARFNVESETHDPDEPGEPYFTGVPTPAAACLILLPMLLGFQFSDKLFSDPLLSAAMIALMSCLMVSRLPTPSLKNLHIPRWLRAPLVALAGAMIGAAIIWPWSTLTVALLLYLVSLPIAIASFNEIRRNRARENDL